jgi:hypothetical protein
MYFNNLTPKWPDVPILYPNLRRALSAKVDTMEVLVSLLASGACEKYPDFNLRAKGAISLYFGTPLRNVGRGGARGVGEASKVRDFRCI